MSQPRPALYSDTTSAGGFIFTSGQIPGDANGVVPESMSDQVHQVFDKLEHVLEEAGSSLGKVLRVTVYLLDIVGDFDVYNTVYRERMLPHATPARTTVQSCHLPRRQTNRTASHRHSAIVVTRTFGGENTSSPPRRRVAVI